jgi:hypothetical protein
VNTLSRWIKLAIIIILTSSLGWTSATAQQSRQRYFPETGHTVSGEFLDAYEHVNDPQLLYGYPITEMFKDQATGYYIQYFEKARFELHMDAPAELRVKLTPLGQFIYNAGSALPKLESSQGCDFFPETGFQVCYSFLEFFRKHGGVAQFGYPISNFEDRNGRVVQYFQIASLEWRPDLPPGKQVVVGNLGPQYFDVRGENPNLLKPVKPDNFAPRTIIKLHAQAFPQNSVTALKGQQTIYIIVQDQNLFPVQGARVSLKLSTPQGGEIQLPSPAATDKNGITQISFAFDAKTQGLAQVKVYVEYQNLDANTITSYRLWW